MSDSMISCALEETVWRYSKTIAPGFFPNRYHEGRQVKEADLVFHFVNSMEAECAMPASYREFSADELRIDAVVVSLDCLYLIEAKGTFEITQGLGKLEEQAKVFEDASSSLRFYLVNNIVRPFSGKEWGSRKIENLWGIVLADTFQESLGEAWKNLDAEKHPVLSGYKRSAIECLRYRKGSAKWFILLAYKHIASPIVYFGERKFTQLQA